MNKVRSIGIRMEGMDLKLKYSAFYLIILNNQNWEGFISPALYFGGYAEKVEGGAFPSFHKTQIDD